jgi:hypothetical protein
MRFNQNGKSSMLRSALIATFLLAGCATVKTHHVQSIKAEFTSMPTWVMPPPKPHSHGLQIGATGFSGGGEDGKPRLNSRIQEWQGDDGEDVETFLAAPGTYRVDWEKFAYHVRYFNAPNERLSLFGGAQLGHVNGDLFTAYHVAMGIVFPLFSGITITMTPALGWQDNRVTYVDSLVEFYRHSVIDSVRAKVWTGQLESWHGQAAIAFTLSRVAAPGTVFIPYLGYQYAMALVRNPPYPSEVLRARTASAHAGMRWNVTAFQGLDLKLSAMDFGNRHETSVFWRAEAGWIHAFGESQ